MKYIKCPRCQINYILPDQKLCHVCLDEINNFHRANNTCIICGAELADNEYEICNHCLENLSETSIN